MAKFTFRLEPLLKLRKLRQQESERAMAKKVSSLLAREEQVRKVVGQIERHYEEIRAQSSSGIIDPSILVSDRKYLSHLHVIHADQKNSLSQSQTELDQARGDLAEAKKQTDVMVKLRENERNRFVKEQKKIEIRELDDLVSVKSAWILQNNRKES